LVARLCGVRHAQTSVNALDLFYIPLAVLTAPIWAGKKRHGWGERFGKIEALPPRAQGVKRVMLHAVSVGEVSALRALVPMLARECEVVVSATTDTGLARARELFGPMREGESREGEPGRHPVFVVRYPLDFSWSVRRVLDAVMPDAVALVELEVWPNFVKACAKRGIPIAVINGRLSPRSFKGYRKARVLLRPTFTRLTRVAAQDEHYAARFEAMGVARERIDIAGSMKWDAAKIEGQVAGADELAREMGIDRGVPLVVAGSTADAVGESEERLITRTVRIVAERMGTRVQVLCAPRKPERFDEAAAAMPGCVRRTRSTSTQQEDRADAASGLFLLDTIGELRKAYALADIVVMGRSFGTLYGSDPIEPAALGKPTLIGPRFGDFEQIVRAFSRDGGVEVVADEAELGAVIERLLRDATARREMSERARACIRAHQGATARHAAMVLSLASAKAAPG
jgi:3-deoxy-D-manno-octulosonic-acid transferase